MLKITSNGEALVVEGTGNIFYPNNATLEIPFNSIILVVDDSDMATFRSASNNDVLFSGIISDITIDGEAVTRDTIVEAFSAISNVASGGSGGGSVDAYTKAQSDARYAKKSDLTAIEGEIDDINSKIEDITPTGNVYTIPQMKFNDPYTSWRSIHNDNKLGYSYQRKSFSQAGVDFTFDQLKIGDTIIDEDGNKVILIGYSDSSDELFTTRSFNGYLYQTESMPKIVMIMQVGLPNFVIECRSTLLTEKLTQDKDFSYKTINGESILGSGNIEIEGGEVDLTDYYTKEETSNLLSVKADNSTVNILQAQVSTLNQNKQDELVSGTNIKTINGNSILGPGDITISGGEDVDLSNYYTKEQVDEMGEQLTTQINSKLPIDSFNQWSENAATKDYVDNKISEIEIPSLDGYATESYVDNKIAEIPSVDLSDYATKEELEAKADSDDVYTKNEVDTLFNNYIKTYTEDEFEALTDEEKNDGIIFITNNN